MTRETRKASLPKQLGPNPGSERRQRARGNSLQLHSQREIRRRSAKPPHRYPRNGQGVDHANSLRPKMRCPKRLEMGGRVLRRCKDLCRVSGVDPRNHASLLPQRMAQKRRANRTHRYSDIQPCLKNHGISMTNPYSMCDCLSKALARTTILPETSSKFATGTKCPRMPTFEMSNITSPVRRTSSVENVTK